MASEMAALMENCSARCLVGLTEQRMAHLTAGCLVEMMVATRVGSMAVQTAGSSAATRVYSTAG